MGTIFQIMLVFLNLKDLSFKYLLMKVSHEMVTPVVYFLERGWIYTGQTTSKRSSFVSGRHFRVVQEEVFSYL